jgi:pimeloyl-ACP methyl ester carboxylesterase
VSGDLVISGGGSITVATDVLLGQADALVRLCGQLDGLHRRVLALTHRLTAVDLRVADAPLSALDAEVSAASGLALLGSAENHARLSAVALHTAIQGYGRAERVASITMQNLSARLGYAVGFLSPLLMMMAAPSLTFGVGGVLLRGVRSGEGPAGGVREIGDWLLENNSILTNPTTVALVRAAMGSSDDALGGALHLPPSVVSQLGEEGIGLTGLGATAAIVVLLAQRAGMLRETSVSAVKTSTSVTTAPRTLAERAARVPAVGAATQGEQIRVDRYRRPGEPDAFEVYIAGTVDFRPTAGEEPWDLTSNINGIAGLPAGSLEAVRAAMADAGVTDSSPVVLTGYSQGGLVASLIAASGDYNVEGVVTLGAPAGLVEIPPEVPVLTVRHTDDLVPALGGYDVNHQALVVERQLFADTEIPTGLAVPAHQLEYYEQTAALIDSARSPQVKAALDGLDRFAAGATDAETTLYRARRTVEGD